MESNKKSVIEDGLEKKLTEEELELIANEKLRLSSIGVLESRRCISAEQFDFATIEKLYNLTLKIEKLDQTPKGRRFLLKTLDYLHAKIVFAQASTRTSSSFISACSKVGMSYEKIHDLSVSSMAKGESYPDFFLTLKQYCDLIVLRHRHPDIIYLASAVLGDTPLINGGNGTDHHPTQGLLDVSMLRKYGLKDKKIAFVGDLARGRTVRSLASILAKFPSEYGMKLYFVAPPDYQMKPDILNKLDKAGVPYELTDNWEKLIPEMDFTYLTRIQAEYRGKDAIESELDLTKFSINLQNIDRFKPSSIVLHPLPRGGSELCYKVTNYPHIKIFKQVEMGMWSRMALIIAMFGVEKEIEEGYQKILG